MTMRSKGNSTMKLINDGNGDSIEVQWDDCSIIYDDENVSSRACNKPFYNA